MPCPPKTKIGHHRIMPPFPLVGGSPAKPTPARRQPPTRQPATHVCAHFRQTDVLRLRRFWCRRCPTAPTRRAFAGLTAELNEEQPPSKSSRTSLFAAPQCLPHLNVCRTSMFAASQCLPHLNVCRTSMFAARQCLLQSQKSPGSLSFYV